VVAFAVNWNPDLAVANRGGTCRFCSATEVAASAAATRVVAAIAVLWVGAGQTSGREAHAKA
jgi:hypothetical protein